MPAFIQPKRGLVVTFERDGEEPEARWARDATHAVVVAVTMLTARAMLFVGDRLTVTHRLDAAPELPEPSRSSHHSS